MIEHTPLIWVLAPTALQGIEDRLKSGDRSKEAVAPRRSMAGGGGIAGIPIYGVLNQRPSWFSFTSTMEIQSQLRAALLDPAVEAIVLDIDSPGGSVNGVEELSNDIFKAREVKPIYAIANSMAASGAYWIGSAATKLYASLGSEVGSVGVYAMHVDLSGLNERIGVKTTYIASGRFKTEGNPAEPLSPEARAAIQASVDSTYHDFIRQVARNRGVRPSAVIANFGQGRTVLAQAALAANMIDGIATLEQVAGMSRTVGHKKQRQAKMTLHERRIRWKWSKVQAGL